MASVPDSDIVAGGDRVAPAWWRLGRLVVDHLPTLLIAGLIAVPVLDRVIAVDRAKSSPRVDYQVVPVPAEGDQGADIETRRTRRVRVAVPAPQPQSRPAPVAVGDASPRPQAQEPAPPSPPTPPREGLVDQVLGSVP